VSPPHWHVPLYAEAIALAHHVIAVSDADEARATAFAEMWDAPLYSSWSAMLDGHEDAELAYVFAPHDSMHEICLALIEKRIPPVVEKPAGVSVQQVVEVKAAAQAAGVPVAVPQWTGRRDFIAVSSTCADLFLTRLPERRVPPWDFDCAAQDLPDSSAGAIAAAGLLALASTHPDSDAAGRYQAAATDLLVALTEQCSTATYEGHEGLLTSGTWHLAADFAVGEALIYGDYYYYMEALQRLHELQATATHAAQP
jgi:hypothetical protein